MSSNSSAAMTSILPASNALLILIILSAQKAGLATFHALLSLKNHNLTLSYRIPQRFGSKTTPQKQKPDRSRVSRPNESSAYFLLLAFFTASAVAVLAALTLVSANSATCLAALVMLSIAAAVAAIEDFRALTAVSLPAGAFCAI